MNRIQLQRKHRPRDGTEETLPLDPRDRDVMRAKALERPVVERRERPNGGSREPR